MNISSTLTNVGNYLSEGYTCVNNYVSLQVLPAVTGFANTHAPELTNYVSTHTAPAVTQYVSTHNVGSIYCAVVAGEAAVRTVANLAQTVVFATGAIFSSDPSWKETAKKTGKQAGLNLISTGLYGCGAINPIAGIAIPIALATIFANRDGGKPALTSHYFTAKVLSVLSTFVMNKVEKLGNKVGSNPRITFAATGILALSGTFYALNVNPFTAIDFKATLTSTVNTVKGLIA